MTYFYLAAATLVVVALALLLRPWWRTGRGLAGADVLPALNAAIHRDRLGELERDHSNGTLSDADLSEAKEELQRQLLDDTAATERVLAAGSGRGSAIAIAILLPLIAVAMYALLGSPAAVLPAQEQAHRANADMDQLVVKLEKKLEQNPDNPEGWAMLARSYKSMGRWDDAERAFVRIGPDINRSAELLAEYAEMLAQRSNGFDDRSRKMIQQALALEPNNMLALFMGGTEAFAGGRHGEAAALWERLLPQLEPGGEDARMIESRIAEARQFSGAAPSGARAAQKVPAADAVKATTGAAATATAVSGRVELSAALKAKANPDDVVFIFARAVDGPRVPLAALRARAADLPMNFTLDDSQAVMPGANISSAQQLRVEVRISKSGKAQAGTGDLTGKSDAVKPGAKGLRIMIDQVDP
ncbi:MAG: c-type cytochrome biogenesis protein CcmI [Rhodocyclales bacterium]|nr:c-type cytochrome biogenesis protein CcmI [Rhodocyclales bacterium]